MSKAIINRAISTTVEKLLRGEVVSDEHEIVEAHPEGPEGYVRDALIKQLNKDQKGVARALRDGNCNGMSSQLSLPGLESLGGGSLPGSIPTIVDGEKHYNAWPDSSKADIKLEVEACRMKVNAQHACVSAYEMTLAEIESHSEAEVDAPMGEIVAAIETKQLETRVG